MKMQHLATSSLHVTFESRVGWVGGGVGGHSSCQTQTGYRGHAAPPLPQSRRARSLLITDIHRASPFQSLTRHPRTAAQMFAVQRQSDDRSVTRQASRTQDQTRPDRRRHVASVKNSPSDHKRRHNTTIKLMRLLHLCRERPQHGAPVEASRRSARDG